MSCLYCCVMLRQQGADLSIYFIMLNDGFAPTDDLRIYKGCSYRERISKGLTIVERKDKRNVDCFSILLNIKVGE